MNQLRKKSVHLLLIAGMVLFFCVFMFTPKITSKTHGLVEFANAPMAEENQIDSAGFDADESRSPCGRGEYPAAPCGRAGPGAG